LVGRVGFIEPFGLGDLDSAPVVKGAGRWWGWHGTV